MYWEGLLQIDAFFKISRIQFSSSAQNVQKLTGNSKTYCALLSWMNKLYIYVVVLKWSLTIFMPVFCSAWREFDINIVVVSTGESVPWSKHYLHHIVSTLLSFVIGSDKLKIVIFQLFLLVLISTFWFLVQYVVVAIKKMLIAWNYLQIHILDMNKQIIKRRTCCCHSQWINKTFKRCIVSTGIKNNFHKLKKKTLILKSWTFSIQRVLFSHFSVTIPC